MTFRLAALIVFAVFAPLSAYAGHGYNSQISHNMHLGTPDSRDADNTTATAVTSDSTSEVLLSNTSPWENLQTLANAERNGAAAKQIIGNTTNGTGVTNVTNNNGYRYVNGTYTNNYGNNRGSYNNGTRYNGNSDIYLRSQNNNSSGTYANQSRYNFQYGGYALQNNINDIREDGYGSRRAVVKGYQNTGLSGYNFYGNPASYDGAAYQNYRGYDNFVDVIQPRSYNLGYYRH